MTALASLAHLADGTAAGGDRDATWAEYRHIIEQAIIDQPRSQQTRIGPSELGTECLLCLGRKLAGLPQIVDPAWLPYVGTSVHAKLEEVFTLSNRGRAGVRFLTEMSVDVGEVDGTPITGHADLYDLATAEVTDWKIVGATTLRKAKGGPSEAYRTQAHLYGRGFTRRGLPVSAVRIAFLPRNATTLDQAVIWSQDYDEQVALDALARADAIAKAGRLAGWDKVLPGLPAAPGCFDCPRYSDGYTPPAAEPARSHLHDLINAGGAS